MIKRIYTTIYDDTTTTVVIVNTVTANEATTTFSVLDSQVSEFIDPVSQAQNARF
jgi:hypothetical protein